MKKDTIKWNSLKTVQKNDYYINGFTNIYFFWWQQRVSPSKKSEADGVSTKSGKSEDKKSRASEEKKKAPTPEKKDDFVVGKYSIFSILRAYYKAIVTTYKNGHSNNSFAPSPWYITFRLSLSCWTKTNYNIYI